MIELNQSELLRVKSYIGAVPCVGVLRRFDDPNMRDGTCGVNIKLFLWNFNGLAGWELLFWGGNNLKLAGDCLMISNT